MKIRARATNQTVLTLKSGVTVFVSYDTPVAAWIPGSAWPGFGPRAEVWREADSSSRTTAKHINRWLRDQRLDDYKAVPKTNEQIAALLEFDDSRYAPVDWEGGDA